MNHKGTEEIETRRLILRKFEILSARVMQIGMQHEGVLRKFERNHSRELVDCDMWAIVK